MQKKTKKQKILFVIASLIISCISISCIYFFQAKSQNSTKPPLLTVTSIPHQEGDVVEKNNSDKLISPSFANTIQTVIKQDTIEEDQDKLAVEEATLSQEELQKSKTQKYLEQIHNVHNLITQFTQKMNYNKTLAGIEKTNLPPEVLGILADMQSYEEKYLKFTSPSTKLLPEEGKLWEIIGHFIQIQKLPETNTVDSAEYNRILQSLHILTDYYYSERFLKQALSHD